MMRQNVFVFIKNARQYGFRVARFTQRVKLAHAMLLILFAKSDLAKSHAHSRRGVSLKPISSLTKNIEPLR